MDRPLWIYFAVVFFIISIVEFYFILYPNCPKVSSQIESELSNIGIESSVEHRPQSEPDIIEESTPEGSKIIEPSKTGEFPQWKELKKGMTKAEVRSLLGKPKLIKKGISEIWRYNYTSERFGDVVFYKDRVVTWLEPVITLHD